MPPRVLRLRSLMDSSLVRGLLVIGMYSSFFFGALALERRGFGPVQTGLAFLPMTLTVALLSLGSSARLMGRMGPGNALLGGLGTAGAGLLVLAATTGEAGYFPGVFAGLALMGLGLGTAMLPLMTIAMSEVPAADAGLGSGILNVSMWLSAALGLAVLGTVAQGAATPEAGYRVAFLIAAGSVAAGFVVALVRLRAAQVGGAERHAGERARDERPGRRGAGERPQVAGVAHAAARDQREVREAAVELVQ